MDGQAACPIAKVAPYTGNQTMLLHMLEQTQARFDAGHASAMDLMRATAVRSSHANIPVKPIEYNQSLHQRFRVTW